jgi:hypothetical protein
MQRRRFKHILSFPIVSPKRPKGCDRKWKNFRRAKSERCS